MKLKKLLPITLLALVSLASCDPQVDTTPPVELPFFEKLMAESDEGLLGDDVYDSVLDHFDETLVGINAVTITGVEGYTPQYFQVGYESNSYLDYYEGYGLIDGDAVETGMEVYSSEIEEGDEGWDFLEPEYAWSEVTTVWEDDDVVNLVNLSEDDVEDPYSFAVAADADDVDIDDFKTVLMTGDKELYMDLAIEAYAFYSGQEDTIAYIYKEVQKVVDEDGDYLVLRNYNIESWFGVYSGEAAWGEDYAGYYVDRGFVHGYEAVIDADGLLKSSIGYNLHFIERVFFDLNWKEGDPAPVDPFTFDKSALDLVPVVEEEAWSRRYGYMLFEYEHDASDVAVVLPDPEDYREGDATDATNLFDLERFGFF